MKKVLVCALAALFLMATCLTAFAVPTWTTTTSYVDGAVEVKTEVTEANAGDMLTYLAYQSEDDTIEDTEIIYIDQQTFEAGKTTTFSYTTTEDWVGTVVKSGSSAADVTTPYSDTLEGRSIKVTLAGGDADKGSETIIIPDGYGVYPTSLAPAYTINSVTLNGEETAGLYQLQSGKIAIVDAEGAKLENGDEIVITTEVPDTYSPSVNPDKTIGKAFAIEEDGKLVEKLTVFGEIKTDVANPSGDWGGILITTSATIGEDTDAFVIEDTTNVNAYAALAREGNADGYTFAVQLVNKNGNAELTAANTTHYARIYSKDANEDIVYGTPFAITVVTAE